MVDFDDVKLRNIVSKKDIDEVVGDRYAKALRLRLSGLTYKSIGEHLGVGHQRASEIVNKAIRTLKNPPNEGEFGRLSVRARNTLRASGLHNKEQVRNAVESGALTPNSRGTANYGIKTHREVCEWLGLPVPQNGDTQKTIAKYTAFLEKHGYKVTKIG